MPIKYLVILIFAFGTLTACKKYKDGPNLSLKTEEARLVRKWQVSTAHYSFFSDTPEQGEDQFYIWENLTIEFLEDQTYILENYSLDLSEKTIETGSWEFNEDLTMINTIGTSKRYDVGSNALLSEGGKNTNWRITRLTKKEWWVWYQNQVDPPWMYFKMSSYK